MKVRIVLISLGVAIASMAVAVGFYQLSVPDIESAQRALFRGFDELDRLDAYVVGNDGTFLGKISKGYGSDCLGNDFGAGSDLKSNGLFNTYGKFGSKYSSTSAFNAMASDPPEILIKKDGTSYSVGLLTTSKFASTKGQRISPILLKAWLDSK